jgi:hypothetical protein
MARRSLLIVLAAALTCLTAWAQPETGSYTRLARLSYIDGHVSFQHSSDVDWSAASINLPLESGDRIYTGRDGRAEIEFDDGSIYRLAEDTDVEILSLKEDLIQLRLLIGLSTLTVSSGLDFEIDSPAAAFNTIRQGVYRFDVAENGDTDAIVRKGELEAANNDFSRRIDSGEQMHLRPGHGPIIAQYETEDAWDEWNDRRNADLRAYASRQYVPDNVYIGVSDLDQYGRWEYVGPYGYGWVPFSVGISWSPYSVGRWCYRPLFGWTWVSYEPWGWLPYHYGRWYHSVSFGWCWFPGPAFTFNFWSPGLVSFYSGPGWISWCPLGPGDYYNYNYYHYNRRIYGYQLPRLRALYTRAPGDPFNRNVHGAFRTTQIDNFRNGSFRDGRSGSNWENVSQPWREGSFVGDRLPVRPTASSFRANPDLPAVRPRAESPLPAVVRNQPGAGREDRGRLARITNTQISSSPSGKTGSRVDQGETLDSRGAGQNRRLTPVPPSDRGNQAVRGEYGNGFGEQGGQRIAAPRSSSSNGKSRAFSGGSGVAAPAPARENGVRLNQQNSSQPRHRQIPSDRNAAPQPSAPGARPGIESPPSNGRAEPRSWGVTPESNPAPKAAPNFRPRVEAFGSNNGAAPRSGFSRPSDISQPGRTAIRGNENSRSFGSSRQTGPEAGQNSSTHTVRTPSSMGFWGGSAPPSERISAGRSGGTTRSAPEQRSGGGQRRR